MDPMEQVFDFFKRLVKGRIDSVEIGARSKAKNIEYKAKSKAANAFNGAVDGAIGKATGAAKAKKPGGAQADTAKTDDAQAPDK